MIKIYRTLRQV